MTIILPTIRRWSMKAPCRKWKQQTSDDNHCGDHPYDPVYKLDEKFSAENDGSAKE